MRPQPVFTHLALIGEMADDQRGVTEQTYFVISHLIGGNGDVPALNGSNEFSPAAPFTLHIDMNKIGRRYGQEVRHISIDQGLRSKRFEAFDRIPGI